MDITVNGTAHTIDLPDDRPLLWALRDGLGITGVQYGCGIAQCGYCQSGQIMQAVDLLTINPEPTDEDIDQVMSGNLCRYATYPRIRAAIHDAVIMIWEAWRWSSLEKTPDAGF